MLTQILHKIQELQNWLSYSTKLSIHNNQPPFIDEGQIWWCHVGENLGTEINGKNLTFTRPIIVYKKLSRYTYLVIPCSTKIKEGSWYVRFFHNKIEQVAVLSQIRVIDYRRFFNKIGDMDKKDFQDIVKGFNNLYQK
jgi:mRNA interferase MazF